jgi:5-methylcytosine-specific restriction endonuclease McrA
VLFLLEKEGLGGVTEYKSEVQKRTFYKSGAWNKLRQQAMDRDNRECQQCKREGKVHVDSVKVEGERKSVELNVHHKYEIEHYPQLALVLDNLETLCLNCHNKMHNRVFGEQKRKRWDDEMW